MQYDDIPYESRPLESLLPSSDERKIKMLGWILANTFPSVSANQTFLKAEVDPMMNPVLDDNDAYAAVQLTLWVLLERISLDEVYLLDCKTGINHPKSARMRAAVIALLDLAKQYADVELSQSAVLTSSVASCCGSHAFLQCYNQSIFPTDSNEPYFVFQGGPNEVRTVCGRLLIGPFCIQSGLSGKPQIKLTPFCDDDEAYSWSFMDFCGNPMEDPSIGEKFYLALRIPGKFASFTLSASFSGMITRVIGLQPQSAADGYQSVGTAFEDESVTLTAELRICAEFTEYEGFDACLPCPPCPWEPPCPPCPMEPPCPMCPMEPPCPPCPWEPTCPPEPPCPMCPMEPPCPPEPTCKLKPLPCRCAPEPPKIRLI